MVEELIEGHGLAAESAGEFLGPGIGAVADADAVHAGLLKMQGGQFRHFSGADDEGIVTAHVVEDLLGQFHGGVADGHRA